MQGRLTANTVWQKHKEGQGIPQLRYYLYNWLQLYHSKLSKLHQEEFSGIFDYSDNCIIEGYRIEISLSPIFSIQEAYNVVWGYVFVKFIWVVKENVRLSQRQSESIMLSYLVCLLFMGRCHVIIHITRDVDVRYFIQSVALLNSTNSNLITAEFTIAISRLGEVWKRINSKI